MQFTDNADETTEYKYDQNGNMTQDLNANISSIQYNCLNLPKRILFTNRHVLDYVYNADGELQQMSARALHQLPRPQFDTKYYAGNVIFTGRFLSMLLTDEGYVTFGSNGTPTYHYYLKDHLGNVRVVFKQTGVVEQRNDYYPSGALMATSTGGSVQPYKYNGKELERIAGLDLYDYGARWMDSKIGARFTTIDPMCEKYYDISPYAYCAGNPVNLIDPDGRIIDLSRMNDEEQEHFMSSVNVLRENSVLFNNLYSVLDESDEIYFIQYSEIRGDGIFDEDRRTISFSNRCLDIAANVMSEELFHAYQYENRDLYEKGEFNREFEAKVFAVAVCDESDNILKDIGGVDEFQGRISPFRFYGNNHQVISTQSVMSKEFIDDYLKNANVFMNYNIQKNIGNVNYRRKTETSPKALQSIIKLSYK